MTEFQKRDFKLFVIFFFLDFLLPFPLLVDLRNRYICAQFTPVRSDDPSFSEFSFLLKLNEGEFFFLLFTTILTSFTSHKPAYSPRLAD
jgi:hypothetical protein